MNRQGPIIFNDIVGGQVKKFTAHPDSTGGGTFKRLNLNSYPVKIVGDENKIALLRANSGADRDA